METAVEVWGAWCCAATGIAGAGLQ